MPVIKKITAKLTALQFKDIIKTPCATGQIARVPKAKNADESKIRENAINGFISTIHNQSEFYELAKNVNSPLVFGKSTFDPRTSFYNKCQTSMQVALPILARIKNKVLRMKGYQISNGLAQAMGQAFELYGDIIEKLYIESSGTNDEMLSVILAGLTKQKNFKTLAYKKSKLGEKSFQLLTQLV